ncbi:hypothetical protein AX14_012240 [Amanita brunnescens Koide BX004]|nr:hypothetical protein AX14_012240 [Amanita brunnescens Koide BX004]
MKTGREGYKFSSDFKQNFAYVYTPKSLRLQHNLSISAYPNVIVEFIGVWDTVSSVGIIPQPHPYSSIHYCAKYVRHALSLDETRCRFRPDLWCEVTSESEQDLDLYVPKLQDDGNTKRDDWEYTPPNRDRADVKEVWFSGEHADVGGGSSIKCNEELSLITLRWMIKECMLAKAGILFDKDYLRDTLNFDLKTRSVIKDQDELRGIMQVGNVDEITLDGRTLSANEMPKWVLLSAFWEIVLAQWFWALLEYVPMSTAYQDHRGNWFRRRELNRGQGRFIPFHKNKVLVHNSVKYRLENATEKRGNWGVSYIKYVPLARNWDNVEKSRMVEYVD